MKVTIKVYDVHASWVSAFNQRIPEKRELMFTLILPAASDIEAGDVAEFAKGGFSLGNCQHPSDWYAGLRMAYMGLKSAYHFDGDSVEITADITG